ncbi:MAG: hypothetical protein AAF990_10405 [Bacteroidota bacterium]
MRKESRLLQNPAFTLVFLLFFMTSISKLSAEVIYDIPLKGAEHQIGNLLEWSTLSEENSELFVIEKSEDGLSYVNIGVINAGGEANAGEDYRFLDINASEKRAYYRLKQVDFDGTASFSQTVTVTKLLQNDFMVISMSNTTTNKIFDVSIDAVQEGALSYEVKSMRGETIKQGQQDLYFGLNDFSFDLEDEQAGIYKIFFTKGEEQEMLVVQKIDDEIKRKENVASNLPTKGG